jgi:glycosyltransferase involved in cell wall biosynthesis
MQKNHRINLFNWFAGYVAWLVFWAIIGGISLGLKFYYLISSRFGKRKDAESTRPMRIAFCENGAGYGGAVISLAAFLEKIPTEFEAFIYTSIGSEEYCRLGTLGNWKHIPPIRLINAARLYKLRFPFASFLDNLFNLLPYAWRYFVAFKRDKIECVYLNNDASCNFAAAIAAKFARLPLILHARGFNCDTKGNRWVLSKVDHCIAVSTAVKTELLTLGVPAEKCTVVPEGLDLTVFHPKLLDNTFREELNLKKSEAIITLVGGLVDWKGQDVLLDAAPLIFEKFPHAIILIVGAAYGKDNHFARIITERAEAPNMRSRVRMLGARKDVADILACSDVVVHASTKPEPFGRTFLEGMALGKAVIASNEGGPLDVITHKTDGLLIEPRNPRKLAEAINYLLTNTNFSIVLGKNAAVKARIYSIENHVSAISLVLRQISSKSANSLESTGLSILKIEDIKLPPITEIN